MHKLFVVSLLSTLAIGCADLRVHPLEAENAALRAEVLRLQEYKRFHEERTSYAVKERDLLAKQVAAKMPEATLGSSLMYVAHNAVAKYWRLTAQDSPYDRCEAERHARHGDNPEVGFTIFDGDTDTPDYIINACAVIMNGMDW